MLGGEESRQELEGTVDELTNFGEKLESAIDGRSVAVVGWRWPYVA